ncbi:MAG: hypothetical protein AB8G95_18125 [Anaerolineae bacterium]
MTSNQANCEVQESPLCSADDKPHQESSSNQTREAQAVTISSAKFTPFAIVADGSESSTIEIELSEAAISVTVEAASSFPRPSLDGSEVNTGDDIGLYDDGTHGDRIANDNIWSRGGFTLNSTAINPGDLRTFRIYDITVTTGAGTSTIDIWGDHTLMLIYIDPDELIAPTNDSANSILVGTYAYNNYKGGRDAQLVANESAAMKTISSDLFTYLDGDDVDFILIFSTKYLDNGASGRAYPVQNDIQNIGISTYDLSNDYGSPGRLKKAIIMNFSGTNGPTLHEMAHQWGANGLSGLGFHNCGYGGHWGAVGLGEGQLGGFNPDTVVDNGDGTFSVDRFGSFANGGDSVKYAQLEQYLMGMIPSSEVDPIKVPAGLDCDSFVYTSSDVTFKADSIDTITIDQIKTELGGERIPPAADAQKSFKVAYVAVSEQQLTAAELSYFNSRAKILTGEIDSSFLNSFPDATNNIGSVDATTKAPPAAMPGPINLIVSQTDSVAPQAGDTLTLTLNVENSGTIPAENVVLTATLDSQVVFAGANAPSGITVTQALPDVVFTIGSIPAGALVMVEITYMIPASIADSSTITTQFKTSGTAVSDETEHIILLNAKRLYLPLVTR